MTNNILFNHPWNVTPQEARNIQKTIAPLAIQEDQLPNSIRFIAGADVHYNEQTKKQTAAIVVIDSTTFQIVDEATYTTEISFPYISGLFSFREIPSLLETLKQL